MIVAGNKCDLVEDYKMTNDEINEEMKVLDCKYHLTSAMTRENVDKAFDELIVVAYERFLE